MPSLILPLSSSRNICFAQLMVSAVSACSRVRSSSGQSGAAFLCNLAVCQDYDLICSLHGAHAVGNDQDGLALQQP